MIHELIPEDNVFLIDTMTYLAEQPFVQRKDTVYEENDIIRVMQYFINSVRDTSIALLNRLYNGNANFYTRESAYKYFITMLINDFELQQTNPSWLQKNTFAVDEYRSRTRERYAHLSDEKPKSHDWSEDIKNYNWWDDENKNN